MKSVTLTLKLTSTEPTTDDNTAIEMSLDRLGHPQFPKSIVSMLHDAGFHVSLPIGHDVLDCGVKPELGDERFELDGTDRTAEMNERLRECILSLAHLTRCDSDGYCEFCGFQDPYPYKPTHRSKDDGSDVMVVRKDGTEFVLMNENGDEWPEPDLNDWQPIAHLCGGCDRRITWNVNLREWETIDNDGFCEGTAFRPAHVGDRRHWSVGVL